MTLCVINSEKLADLPADLPRAPRATISMTPQGRAYFTAVMADIGGIMFCLYSETHADPRIPADVAEAVAAFNTDPAIWERLVSEALDAEDEVLAEDRESLNERVAQTQALRARLLGVPTGG